MHHTNITFFDIPTTSTIPSSPNTWKVRLVLNFKGLHFQTQWVPTTEIESVCISQGIPPTGTKPSGEPHYTLPAIIDHTSELVLSDSTPIIEYLERVYPSPHYDLFPKGSRAFHAMFENFIATNILSYSSSLWIMGLYQTKLPVDQVHFRKRMEERFGKPLEKIELSGPERERAYGEVESAFSSLAEFLDKNTEGDYIMGKRISFSDFALWSCLISLKTISPDEAWVKLASWNGGRWVKYFQKCEEWMAVDHYHASSRM
ncbi:hypothetical protein BD779DRAFT_1446175 [Infundibulicybe gibba]|nr:hypothetical protein BD779DRAFT_1446175 [Infundibulicybe gibba]